MIKVTILEGQEKAMYEFEGEVWEKEINELHKGYLLQDAWNKNIELSFEEYTEIQMVTVDEYDGEYDVNLNTYKFRTESVSDFEYEDKCLKSYKRLGSALSLAEKQNLVYEISNC